MKVNIRTFSVDMKVKNNGIKFEVRDNDDTFRGNCYLTRTGITWCEGRTTRANGNAISWNDFINRMNE